MKKTIFFCAVAALALASCAQDANPDVPIVIPDPVTEYGGSGNLTYGDAASVHTYSWKAEGTQIIINVNVDTEVAVDNGDWEIGHFTMPLSDINAFLDDFVAQLDEDSFYALEPDGSVVEEMTSYKPGMWLDADSYSADWSSGSAYWQWYAWGNKEDKSGNTITYDYGWDDNDEYTLFDEYKGWFIIGTNPSNVALAAGKTITSKCVIESNGTSYDFIVNIKFSSADITYDWDETPGVSDYSGSAYLKDWDFNELSWAPVSWSIDSDGFNFEATYSISQADGAWAYGYLKFDTSFLADILGAQVYELSTTDFYPLQGDGVTPSTDIWTVGYGQGQWVDGNGDACHWDTGHLYWWFQTEPEVIYEDLYCTGALVFGTNPDNVVAGEKVTSKNMIKGHPFNVTLNIVD